MLAIFRLLGVFIVSLFKPRWRLEAEILFLRHQLNIALRQRSAVVPANSIRPDFHSADDVAVDRTPF
jgi:hypothetical protein